MKAGVIGREWCEGCGQEKSFSGFVCAMATHGASGRFLCSSCREEGLNRDSGASSDDLLDELILERGYRYCAGCGREVTLRKRTIEEARRRPFTCRLCHGLVPGPAARERYLEHEATKSGGLDRAAARIYSAKVGIESILSKTARPPTELDDVNKEDSDEDVTP